MPQLLSRMDDSNWLTPSLAEILEQGAAPPGGDGSIREQTNALQQELGELGTPARVINVRPTPSHTLFVARPDKQVRGKPITPADVRRNLAKFAEQHKEWTLGFLSELQGTENAVGILLRADQHQPISLRRMLVRPAFRDHASPLALALGITLEDSLVIRDLAAIRHLSVIGQDKSKQHFLRAVLMTLTLLNTPAELRLAIVGQSSEAYNLLGGLPHALGRLLTSPDDSLRLMEGLLKEIQRRQQWFQENSVTTIDAYNQKLLEQKKTPIPRILLLIDSLSDAAWKDAAERWLPVVRDLVKNGAQAGIHLLLAMDAAVPELDEAKLTRMVMRSAANDLVEKLKDFPRPNLRFVDAFVVDVSKDPEEIVPVELCAIAASEVDRAVDYWRQAANKRKQDTTTVPAAPISGATGVTGLFRSEEALRVIAEREAQMAAQRATATGTTPVVTPAAAKSPGGEQALLRQAAALAAYLGWVSTGALRDVLGVSDGDARGLLAALQQAGIVETTPNPIARFMRLADNPLST